MRAWALAAIAVAGCMSYNAGSFHDGGDPFVGRRISLACIDVAIAPTQDARAAGEVLAFTFGNHCSRAIAIDFSLVVAIGRYADGVRMLRAFDPNHELRPLRIDPGNVGREEIAYLADDGSSPAAACVDVGKLETTETVPQHWVCFGAWDAGSDAIGELAPSTGAGTATWPMPSAIDPVVIAMPEQATITEAGKYLASHIRGDQRLLLKALHDYVVLRLHYDQFSIKYDRLPQDAQAVFERHTGVCEGYANLLTALGQAAGLDVRTVVGIAHSDGTPGALDPNAGQHAWNVARVDDGWVEIDATWDDDESGDISTYYLMTPPGIFARTHLADDEQWRFAAPELTLTQFVASTWLP